MTAIHHLLASFNRKDKMIYKSEGGGCSSLFFIHGPMLQIFFSKCRSLNLRCKNGGYFQQAPELALQLGRNCVGEFFDKVWPVGMEFSMEMNDDEQQQRIMATRAHWLKNKLVNRWHKGLDGQWRFSDGVCDKTTTERGGKNTGSLSKNSKPEKS